MNIQQASIYSGKSEKTLRRWIRNKKAPILPAQMIEGRYDILASDLDALLVQPAPDTLSERISALEDRVHTLEGLVSQLSTPHTPIRRLTAPRAPYEPTTASASSTLPDGYTPIADLIKQYNKSETTVMRHMRPYLHPGKWKTSDGRTVQYALDAEGLAEFTRRYVE